MDNKKVVISGGSGLVGSYLSAMLEDDGYDVGHLTRHSSQHSKFKNYQWDIHKAFIDEKALEGTGAIVHLAGASVASERWTKSRKVEILESRVNTTKLLYQSLEKGKPKPNAFVAASAIGVYPNDDFINVYTEDSPHGKGFLTEVVEKWESEVDTIRGLGIRVVKLRIGVVLAKNGGALEKMIGPIKKMVGAPLGTGDQWMGWVHIHDVARAFKYALENESIDGVYNIVAPDNVTNSKFTKLLAAKLRKPLLLPNVPQFVLKLLLGEMGSIVTEGCQISPQKLVSEGFIYKYPKIDGALDDLID